MAIPQDPFILLSYINTQLRDSGKNFADLCGDLDIDKTETEKKLSDVGFEYIAEINQFK